MELLSSAYDSRLCLPADEQEILNLLAMTVGETAASRKTTEFWHWKHVGNPYGQSFNVCARDLRSGTLVGLRTMMPWSLLDAHGLEYRAARAVDTATHPLHQRRGIFSMLAGLTVDELTKQGVPFIFNTPNHNSLPGYLKLGWRIVARWPLLMRPVRPLRAMSRYAAARAFNSKGTSHDEYPAATLAGGDFAKWSNFLAALGSQIERLVHTNEAGRRRVGLRSVRDVAYLSWRYGSHPDVAYSVFVLADGATLAGFAVGRAVPSRNGLVSLVITELFLAEPSVRSASRLIRRVVRSTRADYIVAHAAVGTTERGALRRHGFVPVAARGYTFAARPLTDMSTDPTRAGSWDLTLGDLEIF